jgi:cysteinyl-tRNA synthetase
VPEQIKIVQDLIEKGHAYATSEGDVYFDVTSDPDYGKLSGQSIDDLIGGVRVDVVEGKRHPADFALWRHAGPEHLMQWDSPWGRGFPGWHVECTAMAIKYLGETFDIHGGGLENRFPHNECEIAQSEAWTGKPFANYWLLTGSLTVDGVKMSKSLGNFTTVKDSLQKYRLEALRVFILSSHYSSPVDYSESALVAAHTGWERLMGAVRLARQMIATAPESDAASGFQTVLDEHKNRFVEAMEDDFNAPVALAVLHDLTREVNTLLNSGEAVGRAALEAIDHTYRELGGEVLGIIPDEVAGVGMDSSRQAGLIQLLIDIRKEARAKKDFATSDQIRDRLTELGVALEDRADGTIYKIQ